MRTAKYMVCYILCCVGCFAALHAQHKVPPAVSNIFDNLPIDDPAKNSILRPGEDSLEKISSNVFVSAVVSSKHCFLGEPILLTYNLYSALQSTSRIDKAPSFAGFSVNDMQATNEEVKRKKQDGRNYRVFTLQQVQLIPLQEGAIIIDPIAVYNEISYKDNGQTVHYGGGTMGKAITINVDPLPVAGRPAGFSGAIGNYTLHVTTDTTAIAGETDTLRIELRGAGNLSAVSLPEIAWPPGCEHFSATESLQSDKNSFPPSGVKTFTIPFVPAKEGDLLLPSLQLSFFDAQKKIYHSIASAPIHVQVSPALQAPGHDDGPTVPEKKSIPFYYWLLAAVGLLGIALAGIFYLKKHNTEKVVEKPALSSSPTVLTAAVQEDSVSEEKIKGLQQIDDPVEYIGAYKKILSGFLQQSTGGLPATEEILLQKMQLINSATAATAASLYTQCNHLLYAPGSMDAVTRQGMEQKLAALVKK